jgi:hypothetical protein
MVLEGTRDFLVADDRKAPLIERDEFWDELCAQAVAGACDRIDTELHDNVCSGIGRTRAKGVRQRPYFT